MADWGSVPDWISAIGNVTVAGAAFFATWQGYLGLSAWRDETIGKRKAELTEQALIAFYETRDVFAFVRNSYQHQDEDSYRDKKPYESTKLERQKNQYFVSIERLNQEKDVFAKLHTLRYAFQAYFGEEGVKPFHAIAEVRQHIVGTANILIEMANEDEDVDDTERQFRRDLGWGRREPDETDKKIEQAVQDMEAICRLVLMERRRH